MADKKKIKAMLDILSKVYEDAKPALVFSSPFELLIATMLSAQCTDVQVNKVTDVLFKKFNLPGQFAAMEPEELEPHIKSCGFYHTKAKNIVLASRTICNNYGGEVPKSIDEMQKLPGVGKKTANVVGSIAFDIPAIAVDTHVFRVANRTGLAKAKDVEKTEKQLMANIPKKDWSAAHHWLIWHGRKVCKAQKPRCEECPIHMLCANPLIK